MKTYTELECQRSISSALACGTDLLTELPFIMFGLTGLSKKKQVAKELVFQLMKDLPPELVRERRSKLSVNRVTHQIEAIYSTAVELRDQHRLGFISKAAMINDFQWELKQHNYPLDFIEMVVEGLVLRLQSRKNRKP